MTPICAAAPAYIVRGALTVAITAPDPRTLESLRTPTVLADGGRHESAAAAKTDPIELHIRSSVKCSRTDVAAAPPNRDNRPGS